MAILPRVTLKSFFEEGDFPTEDQFASLIDSMYVRGEDDDLVGLSLHKTTVPYKSGSAVIKDYKIYFALVNNQGVFNPIQWKEIESDIIISDDPFDSNWEGNTTEIPSKGALYNILNNKQNSIGYTAENSSNKATNFSNINDTLYPSVKAVDDRIQEYVTGLWDDKGVYDASSNLFPSTGTIKKGDIWTISVAGTLGGSTVNVGDTVRALTDSPGQTAANWALGENNIGYVTENAANKTGTITGNESSTSLYASIKGFVDWLKQGFTSLLPAKSTPTASDLVLIEDAADSNKTKKAAAHTLSIGTVTPVNETIQTGDDLNDLGNKAQGQLNNKTDKAETLTQNSLLSVDANGRIINTGYNIDNVLKDVSNSIFIDATGNIISSANGGFSNVNIRGASNAYLTALSWDGTALRLGAGFSFVRSAGLIPVTNGSGALGNQTLLFASVFANNHVGANYGASSTINIGRQEVGGVLQSTVSASSTTIAVHISSIPNTGTGGTGDVSLTTGLAGGGGASGNVSLVTLNTSWRSGQKIIFVGNRAAAPTGGNPTGGYFNYAESGNPVFKTTTGAIITLTSTTGWGLPTGTLTRTTFDSSTVTTTQLAERVAALINDLRQTNGLLSA